MLDSISLHLIQEELLDNTLPYSYTKNLFNLNWKNKNIYTTFNPNKIISYLDGEKGNFNLIENEKDLERIWEFLKENIYKGLCLKYPKKPFEEEPLKEAINKIKQSKITKLHVCQNIPVKYPAHVYVMNVFAKMNLGFLRTKVLPFETTVRFENESLAISIYDKNIQFQKKYNKSLKGNWLRIEIQTKTSKYVQRDWGVKTFEDLFLKENFKKIKEKYIAFIKKRLFEYELENKRDYIPAENMIDFLSMHPYVKFMDMDKFFKEIPTRLAFKEYLKREFGFSENKATNRSLEHPIIQEYCNIYGISTNELFNEIKEYFISSTF